MGGRLRKLSLWVDESLMEVDDLQIEWDYMEVHTRNVCLYIIGSICFNNVYVFLYFYDFIRLLKISL